MRFLKSIASVSYWSFSAVMILIGLTTIVLAVLSSPWQLQVALGLIGLGFIASGLACVKRAQNEDINEKRFDQIIVKLDGIHQELQKEEQPKGTGVVIADVLTAGLKYYAEKMNKQSQEEENK